MLLHDGGVIKSGKTGKNIGKISFLSCEKENLKGGSKMIYIISGKKNPALQGRMGYE